MKLPAHSWRTRLPYVCVCTESYLGLGYGLGYFVDTWHAKFGYEITFVGYGKPICWAQFRFVVDAYNICLERRDSGYGFGRSNVWPQGGAQHPTFWIRGNPKHIQNNIILWIRFSIRGHVRPSGRRVAHSIQPFGYGVSKIFWTRPL